MWTISVSLSAVPSPSPVEIVRLTRRLRPRSKPACGTPKPCPQDEVVTIVSALRRDDRAHGIKLLGPGWGEGPESGTRPSGREQGPATRAFTVHSHPALPE